MPKRDLKDTEDDPICNLVLSRKVGESIAVVWPDGAFTVGTLVRNRGGKIRWSTEAPRSVVIHRLEIWLATLLEAQGIIKLVPQDEDDSAYASPAERRRGREMRWAWLDGNDCSILALARLYNEREIDVLAEEVTDSIATFRVVWTESGKDISVAGLQDAIAQLIPPSHRFDADGREPQLSDC